MILYTYYYHIGLYVLKGSQVKDFLAYVADLTYVGCWCFTFMHSIYVLQSSHQFCYLILYCYFPIRNVGPGTQIS